MRVLITGSRTWTDRDVIRDSLSRAYETWRHMERFSDDDVFVVVHGHCPTGADAIADEWAIDNGLEPARYPAEWKRLGRGAGFHRNSEMVNEGADLCLAFIMPCARATCSRPRIHGSHGAIDCSMKAEAEGIQTIVTKRGWV